MSGCNSHALFLLSEVNNGPRGETDENENPVIILRNNWVTWLVWDQRNQRLARPYRTPKLITPKLVPAVGLWKSNFNSDMKGEMKGRLFGEGERKFLLGPLIKTQQLHVHGWWYVGKTVSFKLRCVLNLDSIIYLTCDTAEVLTFCRHSSPQVQQHLSGTFVQVYM